MGKHGKPDWGLQVKKTVYTFDDLSELAVRLGSISQFDRRGDIIFLDGFEEGLGKYKVSGQGTGNDQLIVADRVEQGGYSLKLIGGKTDPWYSSMIFYIPYPVISRMGTEFAISLSAQVDKFYMYNTIYTGTDRLYAHLKYEPDTDEVSIRKGNGIFTPIGEIKLYWTDTGMFHIIKLVYDLDTGEYVRLIVNNTTYDISDYDMQSVTSTTSPYLATEIKVYSKANQNGYANIDNLIITQNEP